MGRNLPSACLDVLYYDFVRFGWRIWVGIAWAGFNKSRARRHLCFNLALLLRYPLWRIQWRLSGLISRETCRISSQRDCSR